jgi:SAM-dependent methyltransferase
MIRRKRTATKRKKTRPRTRPADGSLNVPQAEQLLTEHEYGHHLATYFDLMYPENMLRRLQKPFFQMMVRRYHVQSACDLCCRTGQTLRLLHDLGVKHLTGIDVSEEMIRRSRKKLPRRTAFHNSELGLAPMVVSDRRFDMVLCTKDALSMLLDDETLINFFKNARDLLTDGGVLVVETLNYEKIWRNKERFMPVMNRTTRNEPRLFLMVHDFHEELLVRNLMRIERKGPEWYQRTMSLPIRPITHAEMEFCMHEPPYSKWGYLGSYTGKPFNNFESYQAILIAMR